MTLARLVYHVCLWRRAEHLAHCQVERTDAVGLLESKAMVARGVSDDIHRCTLAACNLAHVLNGVAVDEQSHALLTLVGYYLLARQRLVAYRQFVHFYQSATVLDQLGQAVDVSCGSVVVYGHHGVCIFLAQRTHHVIYALLHLGIGTLHGIQLHTVAVASGVYRRHRASAQSDAVVVAAHHHNLLSGLGSALYAVAFGAVAHAACHHDNLVVAIDLAVLLVLERQQRTADQRLSELVAEVARTVRCLDENLFGCLVQPLAHGQYLLPYAVFFASRI